MPTVDKTSLALINDKLPARASLDEVLDAIDAVNAERSLVVAQRQLQIENNKLAVVLRSRVTTSLYDAENSPKLLIEHLRSGRSFNTFAAVVGASMTAIANWVKKYPAFAEAKDIGNALQLQTWEELLISVANGSKKGDFRAISFALKAYFPKEYATVDAGEIVATKIIIETGTGKPSQPQMVENTDKTFTKGLPDVDISNGLMAVLAAEEFEKPSLRSDLTDLI